MMGTWAHMATQDYTVIKMGRTWAILGGLGGPSGAHPNLPKPNLAGASPDTCLSLL
jgi:hypothetical protein